MLGCCNDGNQQHYCCKNNSTFNFYRFCHVLYFPFTYIFGDVLTEVYGYKQARRATWILIFVQLLTALIYQLVVFTSAPGFKNNEAFTLVFGQAPRIVVGGLIALFAGQFVNDFTMAK